MDVLICLPLSYTFIYQWVIKLFFYFIILFLFLYSHYSEESLEKNGPNIILQEEVKNLQEFPNSFVISGLGNVMIFN